MCRAHCDRGNLPFLYKSFIDIMLRTRSTTNVFFLAFMRSLTQFFCFVEDSIRSVRSLNRNRILPNISVPRFRTTQTLLLWYSDYPVRATIASSIETTNSSDMISCRRRPHVSTKKEHVQVLLWMMQEIEQCGTDEQIAAKALSHPHFSHIFHHRNEKSRKSNRIKASRWWRSRNEYIMNLQSDHVSQLSITSRINNSTTCKSR